MGKRFAFLIVLFLLTTITLGAVCVQQVKAQTISAITINADGTVTPSASPIEQIGNVYALTSDFVGSITVNRSNTVLDGKNHTLLGKGNPALYGVISMNCISNVTVKNLVLPTGSFEFDNGYLTIGISLTNCTGIVIQNDTITDFYSIQEMNAVGFYGIYVSGGGSNVITGNSLLNNGNGIIFFGTQKNLIVDDTFVNSIDSQFVGTFVTFNGSSNNTVYHNNFFATYGAANDGDYENPDSINVWDNGYPDGGNYWADYASYGAKEIDSSGIGNKPYIIDTKNSDRYPLMEPFNSTFYAMQTTSPEISLLSPLNQTYNVRSVPLAFSVDVLSPVKSVDWIGYSLDGKQNVTVTGNSSLTNDAITNVTIANITSGVHSITVYANDTYGNTGASETVTFTIPQPFPTAIVATVSVVVAVVLGLGLLVYFKKRKRVKMDEYE